MTYTIKLDQFEGPFDLLLFFIERDELDINDIPIATITNDFLEYIRQMEALNIDLASEFIVVAATLMRIKAKLLIPRRELDEEGNEIDPRAELVQQLMEYKRYKSVLDEMRELEQGRSARNPRGNTTSEMKMLAQQALMDAELESLTLFKLLNAFRNVMERFDDAQRVRLHKILKYNFTIKTQKDFVLKLTLLNERAAFQQVFKDCENRVHAIFNFLAILELIQMEEIGITVGEGMNNFWIFRKEKEEQEVEVSNDES